MISLFVSYYQSHSPVRQAEIDECLRLNMENPHIDRIVHIETQGGVRPRFADFFNRINELSGPDDINIIANSDIYFDETAALLNLIKHGEAYVLGRWERQKNGSIFLSPIAFGSQDVWVVRGPMVIPVFGDIEIGRLGCDNRISYEYKQAGYRVFNPAKFIRCIHLHISGVRTYTSEVVPGKQMHSPLTNSLSEIGG